MFYIFIYTQSKLFWHIFSYLINHLFHLCITVLLCFCAVNCYVICTLFYIAKHMRGNYFGFLLGLYILLCLISTSYVMFASNSTTFLKDFPMILSWFTPCSFSLTHQYGNEVFRLVRYHSLAILHFFFPREKLVGFTVFVLGEFKEIIRNLSSHIRIIFITFKKNFNTKLIIFIFWLLVLNLWKRACEKKFLVVFVFLFYYFCP